VRLRLPTSIAHITISPAQRMRQHWMVKLDIPAGSQTWQWKIHHLLWIVALTHIQSSIYFIVVDFELPCLIALGYLFGSAQLLSLGSRIPSFPRKCPI